MKPILIILFLAAALFYQPLQANADWTNTQQIRPGPAPNFRPNRGGFHQEHPNIMLPLPVGNRRALAPQTAVPRPLSQPSPGQRHYQPVGRAQVQERHEGTDGRYEKNMPVYFHHDADYYGYQPNNFVYADVDTPFSVPDGFETVEVDGQTYYYNEGVFYQMMDGQLMVVQPVLGAVVDSIPQDYEIVMADGVHYLVTCGVYYQRVDAGFEVVQPPVPEGS